MEMRSVALVAKDTGNALAIIDLAHRLHCRGHHAIVILQADGNAANSPRIESAASGLQVVKLSFDDPALEEYLIQVRLLVTGLSASEGDNLEVRVSRKAREFRIPVHAIEEVVGGRNNPTWRNNLILLDRIYAAIPTITGDDREIVVGPMSVEKYRDQSVAEIGKRTKHALGLPPEEKVVWVYLSPEPEAPQAWSRIGEALLHIHDPRISLLEGITVVLTRHQREKEHPIPYNDEAYRLALLTMSQRGLRVLDHSSDFADLPENHPQSILPQFRPKEFVRYSDLLCATTDGGVLITFFGTDGVMTAPYLARWGVLSIAYLDIYLGGAVFEREKQMSKLPLKDLLQPTTFEGLKAALLTALVDGDSRAYLLEKLTRTYPFPERSPVEIMAEHIVAAVN